jgi:PAS domain S-box-containing protein
MAFSTPRPNLDEALEALRRSEQRYRSLVEATASLTFIADREGQLISDMPAWREITGQGREEILGTGWMEAIHPADREAVADAWRTSVETRSICAIEYRIRRAAGGWTWLFVRAAPVIDRDGGVREYVGLCIDISPAKELEVALERERLMLESVIEQAPVGVALLWGPDFVYRLANERYFDMVPQRDFMGLPLLEAFPEVEEAGYAAFRHVWESQQPARLEEFAVPIDDEFSFEGKRYYSATLTPIPIGGEPGGILIVGVESTDDVRRRAALAEQLEHQRATAETLQRALLPERLPERPGIEFAARYVPAGGDLLVGGDWYDVLELSGGRIAVAVGDVAGKGVPAAAVMGQVRAAVRAYALESDGGPRGVLERIARVFLAHEPAQTTTLTYAEIDAAERTMRLSSAGHLPLLLIAPGGEPELVWEGRTVPLGVDDPEIDEATLGPLAPGTTLVLFTDGLVEMRTEPIDAGFERLTAAATGGDRVDLETLCERLLAVAGDPAGRRDDLALLAVRLG